MLIEVDRRRLIHITSIIRKMKYNRGGWFGLWIDWLYIGLE